MPALPFLLCLAAVAAPALHAQAPLDPPQWRALPNAPVSAGERHEDIFFLNPSLGWVVNLSGEVHKTTDGGETWRVAHKRDGVAFRSVVFADSLRGWAGTVYSSTDPLFETFDGGETWSKVSLPDSVRGICGLSVAGDSTVYGVGTFYQSSPLIKTTDRGATWTVVDMRARATTMIDVRFFSPDSGFVTGGFDSTGAGSLSLLRAVILFTPDGGATWETRHRSSLPGSWIWKLSFPSRGTGLASMERASPLRATVLKTRDSGRAWTEIGFDGNSTVQGISLTGGGLGWAGTHDTSYITEDGGESWRVFDFWPQKDVVNRFRMFGDTVGYAVGKTVFKYSRPVAANAVASAFAPPDSRLFLESRPNPFRGETVIRFALARREHVTLEVYDIRGRRVRRLLDVFLDAGRHAVPFRAGSLPAGPYLYRLRAGTESAAAEMRLLP